MAITLRSIFRNSVLINISSSIMQRMVAWIYVSSVYFLDDPLILDRVSFVVFLQFLLPLLGDR